MTYQPGDFVLYIRNPGDQDSDIELGVVKRVTETGCYVAYHLGDTCAHTPFQHLRLLKNYYAVQGLLTRSKQLGKRYDDLSEDCEDWSRR